MMIKELTIMKKCSADLTVSWTLSSGEQTAYELFLIQNGCVIDSVKTASSVTRCTLHFEAEPMKEYFLLLTVTSGAELSAARAGFRFDKGAQVLLNVRYE